MTKIPKGYTCACGKFHRYTAWVYAHAHINIQHTCKCGRVNIIHRYVVIETIELKPAPLEDSPNP